MPKIETSVTLVSSSVPKDATHLARRRRTRRYTRLLFLIACTIIAVCLASQFLNRSPLDSATMLGGSTSTWNRDVNAFWWISQSAALVFRSKATDWQVLHVDIETGAELPVPPALAKNLIHGKTIPFRLSASPDGRWFLCNWLDVSSVLASMKSRHRTLPEWSAALLSSTEPFKLNRPSNSSNSIWLRDGSCWIEANEGTDRLTHVSFTPGHPLVEQDIAIPNPGFVIGLTPEGFVLTDNIRYAAAAGSPGTIENWLCKTPVSSGGGTLERGEAVLVNPPSVGVCLALKLSHDGARLFWLLEVKRKDWRENLPGPMRTTLGFSAGLRHWEMWLTDLSGGSKKFLGGITTAPRGDSPGSIEWSPDGIHISFIRKGVVWLIQVPAAS
jgi:hypothetical protein